MEFTNILDKVITQPTKIKILRFLVLYKPEMTGRELARFCNISPMQAHRTLNSLSLQGIVTKIRVGNSYVFKLNTHNAVISILLKDIFIKEKNLLKEIILNSFKQFDRKILSATVFGSIADGLARPNSDVDLLIVTRDKESLRLIKSELPNIEVAFYEKTGNRLAPLLISLNELIKKQSTNKTLFNKIINGNTIFGRPVKELLNGRQNTAQD